MIVVSPLDLQRPPDGSLCVRRGGDCVDGLLRVVSGGVSRVVASRMLTLSGILVGQCGPNAILARALPAVVPLGVGADSHPLSVRPGARYAEHYRQGRVVLDTSGFLGGSYLRWLKFSEVTILPRSSSAEARGRSGRKVTGCLLEALWRSCGRVAGRGICALSSRSAPSLSATRTRISPARFPSQGGKQPCLAPSPRG